MNSLVKWGLKTELTWGDCLEEANSVASSSDVPRAQELLKYILRRSKNIDLTKQQQSAVQGDYKRIGPIHTVRFIPSQGPQSWDCLEDKPSDGKILLQAACELLPFSARAVVWAVESTADNWAVENTANNDWRLPAFLEFRALQPLSIVKQIQKLSSFASSGQASNCLVEHLFEACIKL